MLCVSKFLNLLWTHLILFLDCTNVKSSSITIFVVKMTDLCIQSKLHLWNFFMCRLYKGKNVCVSVSTTCLILCNLSHPLDPRGSAKSLSLRYKFHKIGKYLLHGNVSVIILVVTILVVVVTSYHLSGGSQSCNLALYIWKWCRKRI